MRNSKVEVNTMSSFLLRRVVGFVSRSWLFLFKRAVWIGFLGVIMSSIRLALSQSGTGEELFLLANDSNSTFPACPTNASCDALPGHCLNCSFNYGCVYGERLETSCEPMETVECDVSGILKLLVLVAS